MKTFDQINKGDSVWHLDLNLENSTNILKYGGYVQLHEWFVDDKCQADVPERYRLRFVNSKKMFPDKVVNAYVSTSSRRNDESSYLYSHHILDHSYSFGFMDDSLIVFHNFDYEDEDDPELYFYTHKKGPEYFISDLSLVNEIIHNFNSDLNVRIKNEMRKIKENIARQHKNLKQIQNKLHGLEQISK